MSLQVCKCICMQVCNYAHVNYAIICKNIGMEEIKYSSFKVRNLQLYRVFFGNCQNQYAYERA